MNTLGEMRAVLTRWLREDIDPIELADDAINDSIEDLWSSIILAQLSMFLQGPVNASFAPASERVQLVSVADPVAQPVLGAVGGGSLGARSLSVSFTLATDSGSETLESPPLTINLLANQLVQVSSPGFSPGSIGWNVYMGSVGGRRARQNPVPIPFGQVFTETATGAIDTPNMPSPPVVNTTADDIWYIKKLELPIPGSTSYRQLDQAGLESELFDKASSRIATTSPYQYYAWDLINNRTIEIRPAAATTLSPRYFYLQRPRRLRFPNSMNPFLSVPLAPAFIRTKSLSMLSISLQELESAAAYDGEAEHHRDSILRALNLTNRNKFTKIRRYL